nr:hypothetical protein [Variovorax dokdonensis]
MSRHALVETLRGDRPARNARDPARAALRSTLPNPSRKRAPRFVWLPIAQRLLGHWWQRHPLHAAVQMARPLAERAAHERPVALMAASAGVGALVVLTRPWRLLTLSAAIAALLKTSELAGVVNTLMTRSSSPTKGSTP